MGYDYEVQYKQGRDNLVADGLSRVFSLQLLTLTLSSISSDLMEAIKTTWTQDPFLQQVIQALEAGQQQSHYLWQQGILYRKGKIVVGAVPTVRKQLLQLFHDSPTGGHSGVTVTRKRMASVLYWKGLSKDVRNHIRACVVCQRNKPDLSSPAGLLQPLPIPNAIWEDISMDFMEGLPKSNGKDVILVVVDRLSKYAHFLALSHPFTAATVAQVYFEHVFKLHGLPKTIVSDRDRIFLSHFWQELFALLQVALHMSTAYHPQSDGQTKVVNRCLETYLRCMTGEKPKEWTLWLPLAEWWYNSNWHSAIGVTPFEAVYGQSPALHIPYLAGDSKVEAVDRSLRAREECIRMLKFHLERAQRKMKQQADKHRVDRSLNIGDLVYVKLQPYRQQTVAARTSQKLSPKFFGPFPVIAQVGAVAYRLQLPAHSKVHPVFHISQLRKHVGNSTVQSTFPLMNDEGEIAAIPVAILDRRLKQVGHRGVVYLLVQWSTGSREDATWESYSDMEKRFPRLDFTSLGTSLN